MFITLEDPTNEMIKEAVTAGYFKSGWQQDFLKVQILTIEQLLKGEKIKMPAAYGTFKKAEEVKKAGKQEGFDF